MNRAYSLLSIKSIDNEKRVLTGVATTPSTDRTGDIVEPKGAEYNLPIPFLWQHDSDKPVGHVTKAKVTKAGIEVEISIQRTDEPGLVKDRLDAAWHDIKLGLVRGLSIGFAPVEHTHIDGSYGRRFLKWLWLELSAVTVPANADCSIITVKSIDQALLAASGKKQVTVARIDSPGASGTVLKNLPEGKTNMKTVAEQIAEFEASLTTKTAKMTEIMTKSADAGETLDSDQSDAYDSLEAEVNAIEKHIGRLKNLQIVQAGGARPVTDVRSVGDGSAARTTVVVKREDALPPGTNFARLVKVKALAQRLNMTVDVVAKNQYGENSEIYGIFHKTAVAAGSSISGNWAYDLISQEGGAAADFAEFLRPSTIIGKFGMGNIPSLRQVPFRMALMVQTAGGTASWVGQGKPKPLTAFDFDRTTIDELKVAAIVVLTEESIRASNPKSDMLVRDSLRDAIQARLDTDFVNPALAAVSGVSPASVTYGAATVASQGTTADDIRDDIRAIYEKFILSDNPPDTGVWIMSSSNALSAAIMTTALGTPEFPGLTMNGGTLHGLPVITSRYIGNTVALVNASDIFLADEGGVQVDMSREASLQMDDAPGTQNALTGVGTSLVSMFQTNSVAIRAERIINWKRRRLSGVAYLTNVRWGGEVPNS